MLFIILLVVIIIIISSGKTAEDETITLSPGDRATFNIPLSQSNETDVYLFSTSLGDKKQVTEIVVVTQGYEVIHSLGSSSYNGELFSVSAYSTGNPKYYTLRLFSNATEDIKVKIVKK